VDPSDAGWDDALRRARDAERGIRDTRGSRGGRGAARGVAIDDAAFAAHLAACRARGARVDHLDEIFLAWAAGRGDDAALRELERLIALEVDTMVRRVDRTPEFADEVRQVLRVRLLVADDGRVRIDDYAGRGPLRGWLAVAALRVALNLKRAVRPAEPDLLADLVSSEADPELRHLKTLYRAEFREALEAALHALPERQRAVLRLSYVDGLTMVQLGRLYGVHETTAARWVSRAAADAADDARRRLVARLSLSPSSLDSVARMVLSNLDLSISRVLRG
jgi:RNA polymerase sigma-70 factor, ECF subfamily